MVTFKDSSQSRSGRPGSPAELSAAKKRRLRKKKAAARRAEEQGSQIKTTCELIASETRTEISDSVGKVPPKNNKKTSPTLIDNNCTNVSDRYHKKDVKDGKINHLISKSDGLLDKLRVNSDSSNKVEMSSKETTKIHEKLLAEREAKKLPKQNVKTKPSADKNDVVASNTSQGSTNIHGGKKVDVKIKKPNPDVKRVSHEVTKKPLQEDQLPKNMSSPGKDEVDRAMAANREIKTGIEAEMPRDRIKTEREAKKLAKQLAKKKGTDSDAGDQKLLVKVAITKVEVENVAVSLGSVKFENSAGEPTKTTAELRAERRAKQEAQRSAKEASAKSVAKKLVDKLPTGSKPVAKEPAKMKTENKTAVSKSLEKSKPKSLHSLHKVNWFQHLYSEREEASSLKIRINSKELHPAIVRLGVQLSARVIVGSNARCVALLHALKQVVRDYVLPAKTEFARGLEAQLAPSLGFLWSARPATASMTNAVKHLRWQLAQLPNNVHEFDAKSRLHEAIDTYIRDQIEVAGEAISIAVRNKISNGDNILTYGCSSLIEKILKDAWSSGLRYRAVLVGSRSRAHGRELLRRLAAHGVPCTYVNISAISFVMRTINKVVLGAGSLLVNGSVLAHAGTAQVALVAHAFNVPVLVCCETHKFSERVQTDAFVYNEIGNPDQLVERDSDASPLKDWRSLGSLTPLNLTYDVTPPGLVTAVVTELAILPCTSAPVVLRFKLSEYGM